MTNKIDFAEIELQKKYVRTKRAFFKRKWAHKIWKVRLTCVLRSDDEQRRLFWKSRYEKDGKIFPHVTYKDGVILKSRHQANEHGLSSALDFVMIRRSTGKADWTCFVGFHIFGRLAEREGLFWGNRFKNFKDKGHLELY